MGTKTEAIFTESLGNIWHILFKSTTSFWSRIRQFCTYSRVYLSAIYYLYCKYGFVAVFKLHCYLSGM